MKKDSVSGYREDDRKCGSMPYITVITTEYYKKSADFVETTFSVLFFDIVTWKRFYAICMNNYN